MNPDLDAIRFKGYPLYEHQKEGIRALLKGSVILAHDRGLGKTLQALCALKFSPGAAQDKCYVIASPSVEENWYREANEVGVDIEVVSWAKIPAPPAHRYRIIGDECHRSQSGRGEQKTVVKNGKLVQVRRGGSARAEAFLDLALSPNCQVCWPLSGTPMRQGKPQNIFPLLQAIKHPLARNPAYFFAYYCQGNGITSHLHELFSILKHHGMLRRRKADCLDLPPMTIQLKKAVMSGAAQRVYDATFHRLREEYQRRVSNGTIQGTGQALTLLTHALHAQSIAKVETTLETAEDILDAGYSVAIYTNFVGSAQQLHDKLGGELLTGETPQGQRQKMIDRFQAKASRVFVSTIGAGGEGITLTAAPEIILHDRRWVSDDAGQAMDRVNRIGQTGKNDGTITSTWVQMGLDTRLDDSNALQQERTNLVLDGRRVGAKSKVNAEQLLRELFT